MSAVNVLWIANVCDYWGKHGSSLTVQTGMCILMHFIIALSERYHNKRIFCHDNIFVLRTASENNLRKYIYTRIKLNMKYLLTNLSEIILIR